MSLLTRRTFHTYAAKAIVLTELFIALGLWWRRTRYAAVWVAVGFHVAIEVSASVQVFSYLAIAALVIWAVPSTRDRVLEVDPRPPGTAGWPRRRPARLAGSLPGRSGPAGSPVRSSTETEPCRRAPARGVAQPIARDGVVRAPGAAPASPP